MSKSKASSASKYYLIYIVGAVLYTILTLTSSVATSTSRFDISASQARLLQLTVIIPALIIYGAAFFGAVRFKRYAAAISKSKDGIALNKIANGLLVLSTGLITNGVWGSLRTRFKESGDIVLHTHVTQFLSLAFPIVAFFLMLLGARLLVKIANTYGTAYRTSVISMAGLGILTSIYTFALLKNPYRGSTPDIDKYSSYYLSDTGILLALVLPSILVWTFGILTVLSLNWYTHTVKGEIYRQAIGKLSKGLMAVISFGIALNFLSTMSSTFSDLSLKGILIFLYVLLILYAVGYLIIASGAKKLALIEEV
jgi:hypothetical protein